MERKRALVVAFAALVAISALSVYFLEVALPSASAGMTHVRQKAIPIFEQGKALVNIIWYAKDKQSRAIMRQNIKDAIGKFTSVLELDGTFSDAYLYRGELYTRIGRNKQAIADFTKAVECNPNSTEAYFMKIIHSIFLINEERTPGLGVEQAGQIDIDLLKRDLETLKTLDAIPAKIKCAQAAVNMEIIFRNESTFDLEPVFALLDSAIEDDPTLSYAYLLRAYIGMFVLFNQRSTPFSPEDSAMVRADLKKVTELSPNMLHPYLNGFHISSLSNQFEQALWFIKEAQELEPAHPELLIIEGFLYYKFGKDKQLEQLLELLEGKENMIAPDDLRQEFYIRRGSLKSLCGMETEANQDFEAAISFVTGSNEKKKVRDRIDHEVNHDMKYWAKH